MINKLKEILRNNNEKFNNDQDVLKIAQKIVQSIPPAIKSEYPEDVIEAAIKHAPSYYFDWSRVAAASEKSLSPLADPVISKIFENEEVSGLAMRELVNAILEDSGDRLISEVVSIVPQKLDPEVFGRSYRIDVEAKTSEKEVVVLEVQLNPLPVMNKRSLMYAQEAFRSAMGKGATWREEGAKSARALLINILEFNMRRDGRFHQVAEVVYREEPRKLAIENFVIHNIELPKFRKIAPNMSKALHCWLTAICRSVDENLSLEEVVKVDTELKAFADRNPGFLQFVQQYKLAVADEQTRKAYEKWSRETVSEMENSLMLRAEGREEGILAGREEVALKMLRSYMPTIDIVEFTELSKERVEELKKEILEKS